MKRINKVAKILSIGLTMMVIFMGTGCNNTNTMSKNDISIKEVVDNQEDIVYNPQKTMNVYYSNYTSLNNITNETISFYESTPSKDSVVHRIAVYFELVDNYLDYNETGTISRDVLVDVHLTISDGETVIYECDTQIDGRSYDFPELYQYLMNKNVGEDVEEEVIFTKKTISNAALNKTYLVNMHIKGYYTKAGIDFSDNMIESLICPMFKNKLNKTPTFNDKNSFYQYVYDELVEEYENQNNSNKEIAINNLITNYKTYYNDDFVLNDKAIDDFATHIMQPYVHNLANQSQLDDETWSQQNYGISAIELERTNSIDLLKEYAIIMEIAREQGIVVTKEDCAKNLGDYLRTMAKKNGTSVQTEQKNYEEFPDNFYMLCLKEKVYDYLLNNCIVTPQYVEK